MSKIIIIKVPEAVDGFDLDAHDHCENANAQDTTSHDPDDLKLGCL